MIAVNDNEMSEQSFLGWLQEADYYLKQTGLKDQFRLNREGEEYLVRGLEKRVRKGLKRAEDFDPFYQLDHSLAGQWEV